MYWRRVVSISDFRSELIHHSTLDNRPNSVCICVDCQSRFHEISLCCSLYAAETPL